MTKAPLPGRSAWGYMAVTNKMESDIAMEATG
jgi:hypothetical protein